MSGDTRTCTLQSSSKVTRRVPPALQVTAPVPLGGGGATHNVNLVGKVSVSPLRPRWVLANGVATMFCAPARMMMKNECLVASGMTRE